MRDAPPPAARRVMVIGLDGATWDLITPWARQGKLPNLAQLMAHGAYGPLASTIPPISAPAWTSFMTGVNPGGHGIYHFQEHIPNSYQARLVSGADVKAPTIWHILSEAGKTSIAINVAMTFPPERVNGIVIAGVDAPGTGSQYTYPAELAKELEATIGEYIIEPGVVEHTRRGRYDAAFQAIIHALEQRFKAVEYLMSRKPWDLFVVNFRATDNIQHHFWHFMDPTHPLYDPRGAERYGDCILQVYQRLDEWIGGLRRRLDPDTVLILVSDHGAGPASAKAVYLNRWLAQQGWLTFAGQDSRSSLAKVRALFLRLIWKTIWQYLRKWLGKRTKDTLRRLFPALYDRARTPASYFAIDWAHTQAYSDEFREAIWINLRGREPQGIVSPGEEYERLRREIARRLSESLIDPQTGEHIVERVYLREELYHGPYVDLAPDIFVQLREQPYYRTRLSHTTRRPDPVQTLSREELLADFLPPGLHRAEGIILLAGPNIKAGVQLHNATIMDAAPTILHLMGLPVPSHMDGRVLVEALEHPGEVRYRDWGAGGPAERLGYSAEEEELVREKLAGLGYLG